MKKLENNSIKKAIIGILNNDNNRLTTLSKNILEVCVETLSTEFEPRVFLINYDKNSEAFDNIKNPSDEDFMDEAELQGTVFTLEGFVKHFNMSYSEINQETDSIRIINVPVSLPV
jgi:hypothetical protein